MVSSGVMQNLLYVKNVNTPNRFGGINYIGFEKLTFVPIQVCLGLAFVLFNLIHQIVRRASSKEFLLILLSACGGTLPRTPLVGTLWAPGCPFICLFWQNVLMLLWPMYRRMCASIMYKYTSLHQSLRLSGKIKEKWENAICKLDIYPCLTVSISIICIIYQWTVASFPFPPPFCVSFCWSLLQQFKLLH